MEMSSPVAFRVNDRSNVAEVRRAAGAHARALGWSATACGESELVATELATNLVKHARDGVIALSCPRAVPGGELVLVAIDRGPGIADLRRSLEDGYSTSGSPGTGLGAIKRLAHETDVITGPEGTVMMAGLRNGAVAPGPAARRFAHLAGFELAKEGEAVSGDAWAYRWLDDRLAVFVCDGLGHGYEAAKVAERSVECFNEGRWGTPKELLDLVNDALRPTRGAAAAVAVIDAGTRRLRYCGVGNIAAGVVGDGRVRHLVSHNGILGAAAKIAELEYAWPAGAVLLMHSDGLSARWQVQRWDGVWERHPALIAGLAYRDLARGTDDAVVVAVREHAAAA
jgi:anti-sigma regulatory factor (Ser/Thr protein kinase)